MQTKSIYKEFSTKLIIATTIFTIVMSFIFYGFTKATIYEDVTEKLLKKAKIVYRATVHSLSTHEQLKLMVEDDFSIDLVKINNTKKIEFNEYYDEEGNHFIVLLYPFDISKQRFIKLSKNIYAEDLMLKKIFSNIFILSIAGLVLIVIYALAVSKTLLHPIINISNKLSTMNERSLTSIDENKLPIEFIPLAKSINNLTKKIQTYVKYQKEIFIGAAHELKTPLAVIKLKSEVTLIKERPIEKYEDSLKVIIKEINGMNKMITSILDMGRQEGAQFEKAIEIDVMLFLKEKVEDYKLLALEKDIKIQYHCTMNKFNIIIQTTLLNQILQNFVQNAIKFTKEGSVIKILSYMKDDLITIDVIDEGIGINEDIDLFAPFKRIGNYSGAGLGLFLAKSAAESLGAYINIVNRKDGVSGSIATLALASNPTCVLPKSKEY